MAVGAILAGVSAVASIAGGISGANNAKKNARKARKAAKKRADLVNKYNKEKFENEKANYLANRQFNYEQAMRQYEYATERQNLEYNNQVRAYNKDQQNLANQLELNRIGVRQAFMREQNVMRDITNEQTFDRMDAYVEGLKTRGAAAASGPAGASGDRAVQMALAEKGRQLAIMDASYTGAVRQHTINMFDIALNKFGADQSARAQTMLEPSKPLPLVEPQITPLMKFTEPMEATPDFVPSPDTAGMVLGGIANAAGTLSSVDWASLNKGKTTPPPKKPPTNPGGNAGGYTVPDAATPKFSFSTNPFSPS